MKQFKDDTYSKPSGRERPTTFFDIKPQKNLVLNQILTQKTLLQKCKGNPTTRKQPHRYLQCDCDDLQCLFIDL